MQHRFGSLDVLVLSAAAIGEVGMETAFILVGFLAIWVAPVWWAANQAPDRRAVTGGVFAALYATLFLAGAVYWYLPTKVANGLEAFASASIRPPLNLSCSQIDEARAAFQSAGQQILVISPEGKISLRGDVWRALPPSQRDALRALAGKIAECEGRQTTGENSVIITDLDTGVPLHRD